MSTLEISQLLGNYGEFIGAIAVVSTLIYLSIQVRANTRSTRSQTLLGRDRCLRERDPGVLGHPVARFS